MTLRNLAAASLAALALAACGDDNDNNTKPITPDTPATPEACKAMKCVYQTEGDFKGSFVTKNDKGEITAVWDAKGTQTHKLGKDGKLQKIENKPEPGKTAGEFDLSGEGINEPIAKETVHGGGIYMRGTKSRHDLKEAPQADLSPIGQFGLDKDWDQSLSNIVIAKTLDANGNVTSVIGAEDVSFADKNGSNFKLNDHTTVFAGAPNPSVNGVDSGPNLVKEGLPTIDLKVKDPGSGKPYQNGSLVYDNASGIWPQQEEKFDGNWDGKKAVRLFGHNAWYKGDSTKVENIFRIAHYDKVINQTALKKATGGKYGIDKTQGLPTDVAFDTLNYVQFGRVTSNVSDLRNADPAYHVDNLQFAARANSASDRIVKGGDKSGTDFYFARGNNPTSAEDLKALPSNLIAYHGNALVFGLDNSFHGGKTAAAGAPSKSLPHSFGKDEVEDGVQTLLGGRGNFVYAQLDPSKGNVEGSIYNVWLVGTYKPENVDASTGKYIPLDASGFNGVAAAFDPETSVKDVFPVKDDLVQFEGKVGGNSIKGDAMNYAGQKGKFAGALFGKQAEEISGVITSNTEEYGKPDASPHWGAVFGAKVTKTAAGVTLPAMGGSYTSWLHEKNK